MTPKSFCELTCLSSVVFNLTCNWHSFLDQFTGSEHRFGLLQSLNDYTMNIHIDGVPINQSNQSKSLGLIIDYPLVSVLLSESRHLFQCTLQLKYAKVLSIHTSIIAALYGSWLDPTDIVRNFKNFKIVPAELSPNLATLTKPYVF